LNLPNSTAAQAGDYSVLISNSLGATTSIVAHASVRSDSSKVVRVAIQAESGNPMLKFEATPGQQYRIEWTPTLALPIWSTFTNLTSVPSSGTFMTPLGASAPTRFFRVIVP